MELKVVFLSSLWCSILFGKEIHFGRAFQKSSILLFLNKSEIIIYLLVLQKMFHPNPNPNPNPFFLTSFLVMEAQFIPTLRRSTGMCHFSDIIPSAMFSLLQLLSSIDSRFSNSNSDHSSCGDHSLSKCQEGDTEGKWVE